MYLFFDIECASVNKTTAKICAFGYCLTDDSFHVVEQEDVLVNPHGGFHLTDRRGERGLVLPYDYDKFKSCPDFPQIADRLYRLLQDENTLVCGHATGNDVKYLNLETKRFSLPSFSFSFADTQYLYMCRKGDMRRQYKLETIASELGVEFTPHCAVDDAYASMKIAEALCREENTSLRALIEKYRICLGKIADYVITPVTSSAGKRVKEESRLRKESRARALAEFHRFADGFAGTRNKRGEWKKVRVCFSRQLEEDEKTSRTLLRELWAVGAKYAYKPSECDVYVCFESENGVRKQAAIDAGAEIFTPTQCLEKIRDLSVESADKEGVKAEH